jgi:hypothetical protein
MVFRMNTKMGKYYPSYYHMGDYRLLRVYMILSLSTMRAASGLWQIFPDANRTTSSSRAFRS